MSDHEEMVWMDRVIYYEDGRTEIQRQWVPSTYCKHDDGDCHANDPCAYCPIYKRYGSSAEVSRDA
jgi:hypothetical protein